MNMNDINRQKYMVSLVKCDKRNYEEETLFEMKRAKVPNKKANSRAPNRLWKPKIKGILFQ